MQNYKINIGWSSDYLAEMCSAKAVTQKGRVMAVVFVEIMHQIGQVVKPEFKKQIEESLASLAKTIGDRL